MSISVTCSRISCATEKFEIRLVYGTNDGVVPVLETFATTTTTTTTNAPTTNATATATTMTSSTTAMTATLTTPSSSSSTVSMTSSSTATLTSSSTSKNLTAIVAPNATTSYRMTTTVEMQTSSSGRGLQVSLVLNLTKYRSDIKNNVPFSFCSLAAKVVVDCRRRWRSAAAVGIDRIDRLRCASSSHTANID